jgi:hypothetical protein
MGNEESGSKVVSIKIESFAGNGMFATAQAVCTMLTSHGIKCSLVGDASDAFQISKDDVENVLETMTDRNVTVEIGVKTLTRHNDGAHASRRPALQTALTLFAAWKGKVCVTPDEITQAQDYFYELVDRMRAEDRRHGLKTCNLEKAAWELVEEAMEDVVCHPCDVNDTEAKARLLAPKMQALYEALKDLPSDSEAITNLRHQLRASPHRQVFEIDRSVLRDVIGMSLSPYIIPSSQWEIPSTDDIPQPYAGAVTLLETIAQVGAVPYYENGKPTENRELCLKFAEQLRAVAKGDISPVKTHREKHE